MTKNADHPIWKTVHWVAIIAVVSVALYFNADEFDSTEYKSIAEIAAAVAAMMGVQTWLAKKNGSG